MVDCSAVPLEELGQQLRAGARPQLRAPALPPLHATHRVGGETLHDGGCEITGLERVERDAELLALVVHLQRDAAGATGRVEHRLDARLTQALDGGVGREHARERRGGVGAERAIGRQQRLGAVDARGQHDHGQPRAFGEPQRGGLEVGLAVQHDRADTGVSGTAQREIEPVARRLRRGPAREHGDRRRGQRRERRRLLSSATRSTSPESGPPRWRAPSGSSAATSAAAVAIA